MDDMIFLSKSKYCAYRQCPKLAWLKRYKPEAQVLNDDALSRMETGSQVGALARGLFGPYTDVTVLQDGRLDLSDMIKNTKSEMEKQTPVICEASFSCDGLYCAVDLLKHEGGGWAIYEVKSSTSVNRAIYMEDVSYQTYVLERCGVKVTGVYLVCLNNQYVYDGCLDLSSLFQIIDVTDLAKTEAGTVEAHIAEARKLMASETEPAIDLSESCEKPGACGFWKYCTMSIPSPSILDLYSMPFKKKLKNYSEGIVSYEDILRKKPKLNEKQMRQITYALQDAGDYTEPEKIRGFLQQLSYPLYFLDFETVQPAVPQYIGTKPYSQIPFQYSLHYIEYAGGPLLHREFLAEPEEDPRRRLAEQLCTDIPRGACVTAYNKTFECSRIRELADAFPDLAEHLMDIRDNIVDLLTPFQSGWYYNRAMGGSFSIKSVLPALFPNDPALDYHNLEEIHHGGEAMAAFPRMADMSQEDRERTRRNLLKYCELDTYAMVKVWKKLCEVAKTER